MRQVTKEKIMNRYHNCEGRIDRYQVVANHLIGWLEGSVASRDDIQKELDRLKTDHSLGFGDVPNATTMLPILEAMGRLEVFRSAADDGKVGTYLSDDSFGITPEIEVHRVESPAQLAHFLESLAEAIGVEEFDSAPSDVLELDIDRFRDAHDTATEYLRDYDLLAAGGLLDHGPVSITKASGSVVTYHEDKIVVDDTNAEG